MQWFLSGLVLTQDPIQSLVTKCTWASWAQVQASGGRQFQKSCNVQAGDQCQKKLTSEWDRKRAVVTCQSIHHGGLLGAEVGPRVRVCSYLQ